MPLQRPDVPAAGDVAFFAGPGPVPDNQSEVLVQVRDMPIIARSPAPTLSARQTQTSCGPDDRTGPCERMVAASPNTTTIPIVLGVVIPLTFAFVVLVYLHRRHVKKLRREDAEDKYKSLDFGMEEAIVTDKKKKRGRGSKKHPEMSSAAETTSEKKDRGLSLDLSMTNPYILPPELHNSRESLHSLSRSVHTGDDKYRATNFIPDDGSLRSPSSLHHHDSASIYTFSSRPRTESESVRGLLPNGHSPLNDPVPTIKVPVPAARDNSASLLAPASQDVSRDSYLSTTSDTGNIAAMRASNNYLGQYISGGAKPKEADKTQPTTMAAELDDTSSHPELQRPQPAVLSGGSSKRNSVLPHDSGFNFEIPANTYELSSGHEPIAPRVNITPAEKRRSEIYEAPGHDVEQLPRVSARSSRVDDLPENKRRSQPSIHQATTSHSNVAAQYENESDYYDEDEAGGDLYNIEEYQEALGYDPRRLTMGMRPLPPDDPTENPEERALRIRSFYKEYFDETTKPGGDKARLSYFDGSENYLDDYYGSNNQPRYESNSQHYATSGHPPRGYTPQPHASYGYGSRAPSSMSMRGPPGRHRAMSNGSYYASGGPGPRAYSSASQRYPNSGPRYGPKKRLPPPQPLMVLPTPAMLKDDSMLPNPMDYAPPQVFKNQRSGTPDSLRGGVRPYSPSRKAYNPLASSFDDLSVLPSPHQLRKSSTFTSLDFAPPRFAPSAAGSDAGSIRSNRSGMSAKQLHHIRAGAYRLSRVPKEVAGTKDELAQALRPQWNAR